jgi:hypothetical protein
MSVSVSVAPLPVFVLARLIQLVEVSILIVTFAHPLPVIYVFAGTPGVIVAVVSVVVADMLRTTGVENRSDKRGGQAK